MSVNATISIANIKRGGTQSWESNWRAGWLFNENISRYDSSGAETGSDRLCIKLKINKDLVQKLTGLAFTFRTVASPNVNLILRYRLYATDPTTAGSVIPTNTIGGGTLTIARDTAYPSGTISKTLSFTGLNVVTEELYLLLTNVTGAQYESIGISCEENKEGQGITNSTYTETPLELTARNATVTTNGSQYIDIVHRAGRTLTLLFKYGNTTLATVTATADNYNSVNCTKEWFTTAGVSTLSQMTVTVSVQGHSGTTSFTLKAGDNMKPVVGTPTVTCVQQGPAASHYPNTFLANISKAKVSVTATAGSNASIRTVVAKFGNGAGFSLGYNSTTKKYEGTTAEPIPESGAFTVTATDARGMSVSQVSGRISPLAYVSPSINIDLNSTFRCNSSGTQSDGGTYYKAKATATYYTGLSGNKIVTFTVKESHASSATAITSGQQKGPIATTASADGRMTLLFVVTDYVGYTSQREITLEGAKKWLRWETPSGGNGLHLGVGKKPDRVISGQSSVDVEVNGGTDAALLGFMLDGMNAGAFEMTLDQVHTGTSFGKNFINIDQSSPIARTNAAVWFWKPTSDSTWSNFPSAMTGIGWLGLRKVFIIDNSSALVMILEAQPVPGRLWFRYKGNSWSSWYKITSGT